jgi:hypothetical protein
MQAFVRMYEPDEAREDTVIFLAFGRVVPAAELAGLGPHFADLERQQFGRDQFGAMVARVVLGPNEIEQPGRQLGGGRVRLALTGMRRPGVLGYVALGPLIADGQVQGRGDDRVDPQDRRGLHRPARVRAASGVAYVGPGGPVVTKRAASLVACVLAVRVVLGPRKPYAQPRALLQRRVERVERVGAELADLHLAEPRPDGAADLSLVRFPGGYLEIGHFQILVERVATVASRSGNRPPSASPSSRPSAT